MVSLTRRQWMAASAPAIIRAQSHSRPNLLLLMADQHRADFIGAESPAIHMPALDRLSREGARFVHAYSSTPTCTPARAGLLTGCSPWRHGMLAYGQVAERYPVEMPRLLGDAGYHTFTIGKLHYHPQRNLHGYHGALLDESGRVLSKDFRSDYRSWFASQAPLLDPDATGIGWNDYKAAEYKLPEHLHPTRWTGDCAVRFLENYDKPNPLFLKVSFARPHSPYDPPSRIWKHYEGAKLPERAVGAWAASNAKRNTMRDDLWRGDLGVETTRHSRHGYAASVTFIDEQLGRILDVLDRRKLLEETLIVYLSDHGDMLGDHHLWRKSYSYEASARIPMIWRGPGFARGTTDNRPAELRDVLPTFLSAAGVRVPVECDGMNLASAASRPWIDLEHGVCYEASNHWNALTDGKWKYVFHAADGREQLFDLANDPQELRDASSDNAAGLRRWRERLTGLLAPRGEAWVKDGRLVAGRKNHQYGPNYPATGTSSVASTLK